MARSASPRRGTAISDYSAKRDFTATREPAPGSAEGKAGGAAPIFVVQKHQAHRAGLHWDFRLEHDGVLWSWAVRRGPSMDPADKRLAAHVEDHPLNYADFQGNIPDGQYGAGDVETWDRGTWTPVGDPAAGLRDGEIKFALQGTRLNGGFVLVRLRPKPNQRGNQDNWLLIKERDGFVRSGADAGVLEETAPSRNPSTPKKPGRKKAADDVPIAKGIQGAVRRAMPDKQAPQLASVRETPPEGDDWVSEIKFDGYRLLASVQDGAVKLITRNGHDWTDRLPAVAAAIRTLDAGSARVDGELVALDSAGVSSFPALQAALSAGRDNGLFLYLFDLLYLDGWDLRASPLRERKDMLRCVNKWQGLLRYSDHQDGDVTGMVREAKRLKLEGIICKRAGAPYTAGRGNDWLKLKTLGREEFVVLGWTEPNGSRVGLGSIQLGYYDDAGELHYAGGCGSGFSDDMLEQLQTALAALGGGAPSPLLVAGNDLEKSIHWVKPALVAEVSYTAWSGAGRLRHAVFLGLREDKSAREVVRAIADPAAERLRVTPGRSSGRSGRQKTPVIAVPPRQPPAVVSARAVPARSHSVIVTASAPKARTETVAGIALSHPDKPLWPGITKRDLATYWQTVADHALPGLARRPLAIVRCPEGIDGEHFFQKHVNHGMPASVREGSADGAPFMAIDDLSGLIGLTQMSTIELHAWGATEADALHPDQLVFDLDPGEDVPFSDVVAAALDLRQALEALELPAYCRTSGGKGLHLVVPLKPAADWDATRAFCKRFAEDMSALRPERYLSTVKIAARRGRILIDWLRNGLGSTAVASFCPRARSGAGVATPLSWKEVTPKLDPRAFTLATVPDRLAKLRTDPWEGFEAARRPLPSVAEKTTDKGPAPRPSPVGKARIVTAAPPRRKK
jgi:bifunctional non-homologous end joining protein LigD